MDMSAWATPIPADAAAWQALPLTTRQAVQDAARHGRPAPDIVTALAAVSAGRAAARWTNAGAALVMSMLALVAIGCPVVNQGLPAGDRLTKTMTLIVVALPGLMVGLGGVAIMARAGSRHRLIGPNLALAATQISGTPRPDIRIGPRWPQSMTVLGAIAYLGLVSLAVFYLHSVPVVLLGLATIVLVWIAGPVRDPITAARIDGAGIDLPLWAARLPWTSVSAVTIAPSGRLSIEIGGPYERTGRRPRHWSTRIAGNLRPGRSITIASRHAEIGCWTARHHLTTARNPPVPEAVSAHT